MGRGFKAVDGIPAQSTFQQSESRDATGLFQLSLFGGRGGWFGFHRVSKRVELGGPSHIHQTWAPGTLSQIGYRAGRGKWTIEG